MAGQARFENHPQSAPGDFYVCNHECIFCGDPHVVAPDMIGWAEDGGDAYLHCVWKKQPETPEELDQAIAAFNASCVSAYRYAGSDPAILNRLGPDVCDHYPGSRYSARESVPVVFEFSLGGYSVEKASDSWLKRLRQMLGWK